MTIRFAILAGVSTDAQAHEGKLSIPDQIQFCRDKLKHEGIETAGPFILDGYSRTNYDSLEVAMQDIPPLGEAIRSASNDLYDVLIMDNYDRLGDLGLMVGARFRKLRKQLHSARQSGKVTAPELYDPYSTESMDIDMYVEGIINRYRINKIRRAWNTGVPDRARQGLHPLCTSFGYRTAGANEPAQQIPAEIQLILQIKDLYLAGKPLQTICDIANASDVKPRRAKLWKRTVIKRIILNPYYAGITIFGRFKTIQGKRVPVPPSQWVRGTGKHIPLYDEETYLALLAEADRRAATRTRAQIHALTGVLSCAVCHSRIHRHGKLNSQYPVDMSCLHKPSHVNIYYDIALRMVAQTVVKELASYPGETSATELEPQLTAALAVQEELRRTVQAGYEAKLYTTTEAHRRIVAVETEIERLTRQRDRLHLQQQQRAHLLSLAHQDLSRLQDWILHDDPTQVNHLLTALCETIEITPRYELKIIWR